MDLATIIGLLLAWGAVVYSMFHASHGALGAYIKPAEIFLVFGGSLGAAMLSFRRVASIDPALVFRA